MFLVYSKWVCEEKVIPKFLALFKKWLEHFLKKKKSYFVKKILNSKTRVLTFLKKKAPYFLLCWFFSFNGKNLWLDVVKNDM